MSVAIELRAFSLPTTAKLKFIERLRGVAR
ncbi:MAG: hypothetical protein JWP03_5143 [Phycisphaerales bacterium]|jgi:hypothetical protein|nr:hypothetical protein [Phycisphaerales bacterium]